MFLDSAPPPPAEPASATTTRVRWENLMVALICVVVAAFGIVGAIALRAPSKPATVPVPATEPTVPVASDPSAVTDLTLADASTLVDEARQLMGEARWDEAADRLASVPEALRDAAGAGALALELQVTRERHDQLRAELAAAIEARRWDEADSILTQLAAIASLDHELLERRATVDAALAPAPVRTSTPAPAERPAAAAATDSRPAAGATATPAATSSKPATGTAAGSSTSRPAASSTASGSSTNSSAPADQTSSAPRPNPLAPVEYTDEQLQSINEALGYATGELQ